MNFRSVLLDGIGLDLQTATPAGGFTRSNFEVQSQEPAQNLAAGGRTDRVAGLAALVRVKAVAGIDGLRFWAEPSR